MKPGFAAILMATALVGIGGNEPPPRPRKRIDEPESWDEKPYAFLGGPINTEPAQKPAQLVYPTGVALSRHINGTKRLTRKQRKLANKKLANRGR